MWVLPKIDDQFIANMEAVLRLYARPHDPYEPMLCLDEKSIQLIEETRKVIPAKQGKPRKRDYEYKRNGTRNIFLAVEPKGGWRRVRATARRTKHDFAKEIARIVTLARYRKARKIHIVLDNLNTHGGHSLIERYGKKRTKQLLRRVVFHHTPKHASWLNRAEIELSILSRQALGRIATTTLLDQRLDVWEHDRNRRQSTIN